MAAPTPAHPPLSATFHDLAARQMAGKGGRPVAPPPVQQPGAPMPMGPKGAPSPTFGHAPSMMPGTR
jgi:hypothetical protein